MIEQHFERSLTALDLAVRDSGTFPTLRKIAEVIIARLRAGNKILIVGNGGSAADAQHIAAEIVGRYKKDRPAYPAIALTTDTSALTAISNDYGFDQVFARQVEGLGTAGDVLLALSTSGRSANVLAALRAARARGLITIGFTGGNGAGMGSECDHVFMAPSKETAIIQQLHLIAAHGICDAVEQAALDRSSKDS